MRIRFDCLQLAVNLKRGMTVDLGEILPIADTLANWCFHGKRPTG